MFTQTVFIALASNTIYFWVLFKGNEIYFRRKEIEGEDAASFLQHLLSKAASTIRSFDDLRDELPFNKDSRQENEESTPGKNNPFRLLYDTVIGPIADLLHGDELIIVPDGPLWLAPFAAFVDRETRYLSESLRIRLVPSLTRLTLITDYPEACESTSGALSSGDPCMEEVSVTQNADLPGARREAMKVGESLKTQSLTEPQATKDVMLKRISCVALVHVAARTEMETGEIVLAPNPSMTLKIPREEDYILTVEDLQTVQLRTKLVVLSCCHSGQEENESEGVVSIVRAFLSAGARSVLVAPWRIDDEGTIELLKTLYQHLTNGSGNRASVAFHQAMKCLRESEKFGATKYWAPLVFIGDDVTITFKEEEKCCK